MMLTTKAKYAVMAMVDMANRDSGESINLENIAVRQNIDLNYLKQIFAKLRKKGLVSSMKGPGGGYLLTRDASEISIADIVAAVEESIQITRCNKNDKLSCIGSLSQCMTHDLWSSLSDYIMLYLNRVTVKDVCTKKIKFKIQNDLF